MGLWSVVKAGASVLFGAATQNSKGAERMLSVTRGVGRWIDEQQFTPEERARLMVEVADKVTEFVKATSDETTERSLTRRTVAVWLIRAEVLMLASAGALYPLNQQWAQWVLDIASFDSPLGWMVSGASVFFFGVHWTRAMEGHRK